MKNREIMIDNLIRRFGFEDKSTIQFASLCEELAVTEFNDKALEIFYNALVQGR